MARRPNPIPSYLRHPSGQARTRINGRDFLLGPFGSEESRIKYGELIAKHVSGVPVDPISNGRHSTAKSGPTVNELVLAFMHFARDYYSKDGQPTDEVHCLNSALRPLVDLYGHHAVEDISPLALVAVREKFIGKGWSRGFCNSSTNRVRRVFKWGVERGIVPVSVWQSLTAVAPLKAGRCAAHDNRARTAVDDERLAKVRSVLRTKNRDQLDLMLLLGCRSGELLSLTWSMIDQTKEVWEAVLDQHKMAHKGKRRVLFFGPVAQSILNRYRKVPQDQRIFPTTSGTFSNVIKRACLRAGVEPFVPHELRHTVATRIRDTIGIEAAQSVLGHAQPAMTAHYSAKNDRLAREVAATRG